MSERRERTFHDRGPAGGATVEEGRRRVVTGLMAALLPGLPVLLGVAALEGCANAAAPGDPMRNMARGSAAKRQNPRWGYRDHAR
ncbi:MAG: hypothetical protein ACREDZ_04155 [Kiloniellales bacterium]